MVKFLLSVVVIATMACNNVLAPTDDALSTSKQQRQSIACLNALVDRLTTPSKPPANFISTVLTAITKPSNPPPTFFSRVLTAITKPPKQSAPCFFARFFKTQSKPPANFFSRVFTAITTPSKPHATSFAGFFTKPSIPKNHFYECWIDQFFPRPKPTGVAAVLYDLVFNQHPEPPRNCLREAQSILALQFDRLLATTNGMIQRIIELPTTQTSTTSARLTSTTTFYDTCRTGSFHYWFDHHLLSVAARRLKSGILDTTQPILKFVGSITNGLAPLNQTTATNEEVPSASPYQLSDSSSSTTTDGDLALLPPQVSNGAQEGAANVPVVNSSVNSQHPAVSLQTSRARPDNNKKEAATLNLWIFMLPFLGIAISFFFSVGKTYLRKRLINAIQSEISSRRSSRVNYNSIGKDAFVQHVFNATQSPHGVHYRVLALTQDATLKEVTKAYRNFSRRVHPDRNSAPGAAEAFRIVHAAYEILSDGESRGNYDRIEIEQLVYDTIQKRKRIWYWLFKNVEH